MPWHFVSFRASRLHCPASALITAFPSLTKSVLRFTVARGRDTSPPQIKALLSFANANRTAPRQSIANQDNSALCPCFSVPIKAFTQLSLQYYALPLHCSPSQGCTAPPHHSVHFAFPEHIGASPRQSETFPSLSIQTVALPARNKAPISLLLQSVAEPHYLCLFKTPHRST